MDGYLRTEFLRVEKMASNGTNSNHLGRGDDFVIYCDASSQGLGAVLVQHGKVIAYASR